MTKVLMIGIDALDRILLNKFESELPNFQRLQSKSPKIKSVSVSPPDSNTAWASIYTGLDPSKHGIVHFMDPLERISAVVSHDIDNSTFMGNTFWDIAGRYGRKVCILFPHLGYPVWPVNGIMIGRSAFRNDAEIKVFPNDLSQKYDLTDLNVIPGFAGRADKFKDFIYNAKGLISRETEIGLAMLNDTSWDLFFIYSSVLDTICHNFWNYCDENDPTYIKGSTYENVIKDFYKIYDDFIGKFIANAGSDTITIIFSDHGHGMRPIKIVNINELLRAKGFLVSKADDFGGFAVTAVESIKKTTMGIICKYNLGPMALKVLKIVPSSKKLYTYPLSIDLDRSSAYVLDLSGIKAYSYGGIKINRNNLPMSYEKLRDTIIKELCSIKDPNTEEPIVVWALKREDLYNGQYIKKYPDIIFQLREDYGAGNAIHASLIARTNTHNVVPGSHKMYSPTFIISNINPKYPIRTDINIMDISPTVLDLLGITDSMKFDGKSILQ